VGAKITNIEHWLMYVGMLAMAAFKSRNRCLSSAELSAMRLSPPDMLLGPGTSERTDRGGDAADPRMRWSRISTALEGLGTKKAELAVASRS
jgi:hypothetical protein